MKVRAMNPPRPGRREVARGALAALLLPGACRRSVKGVPAGAGAKPIPGPPGKEIQSPPIRARLAGRQLHLVYQPASAREAIPRLDPVAGTLLVAIAAATQEPRCRPLVAALPAARGSTTVTLDVAVALGLGTGVWFVHATFAQHRSEVCLLDLA